MLGVSYGAGLVFGVGMSLLVGWKERPKTYIDTRESSVVCDNGRVYPVKQLGTYAADAIQSLDGFVNGQKARRMCAYETVGGVRMERELPTPDYQNYRLDVVYVMQGSWKIAILTAAVGSFGSFVILTVMLEALSSITTGRRFSLRCLTCVLGNGKT